MGSVNDYRECIDGARRSIVEEPLAWAETYQIQWREPRVDLAELAKLRWIEGLATKDLAARYGKTICAIQNYYQELRRLDLKDLDFSKTEKRKIKKALAQK